MLRLGRIAASVFKAALIEPEEEGASDVPGLGPAKKRGKKRKRPACEVIDETMEEYGDRIGRWTLEAYSALLNAEFWRDMFISDTACMPQTHLEFWLEKVAKSRDRSPSVMIELVTQRCPALMAECEARLCEKDAFEHLWGPLFALMDPAIDEESQAATTATWVAAAVHTSTEMYADSLLRIRGPCASFPLALTWLVQAPPRQASKRREEVVSELLTSDASEIRCSTSMKIRKLFRQELDDVVRGPKPGTLDPELHELLSDIFSMMFPDNQLVEGLASNLKTIVKAATNTSWMLLMSRMRNKRALKDMMNDRDRKHRELRDSILDACVALHEDTVLFMESHDERKRYIVEPSDYPVVRGLPSRWKRTKNPHKLCAIRMVRTALNELQTLGRSTDSCVHFVWQLDAMRGGEESWSSTFWLAVYKFRTQLYALGMDPDGEVGDRDHIDISFHRPFSLTAMFELLYREHRGARTFQGARNNGDVDDFVWSDCTGVTSTGEFAVTHVPISWVYRSTNRAFASIDESKLIVASHLNCQCGKGRRSRGSRRGGRGAPAADCADGHDDDAADDDDDHGGAEAEAEVDDVAACHDPYALAAACSDYEDEVEEEEEAAAAIAASPDCAAFAEGASVDELAARVHEQVEIARVRAGDMELPCGHDTEMETDAVDALRMHRLAKQAELEILERSKRAAKTAKEAEALKAAAREVAASDERARLQEIEDANAGRAATLASWVSNAQAFVNAAEYANLPKTRELKRRCTSLVEVEVPEASTVFIFWDNPSEEEVPIKDPLPHRPKFLSRWQGRLLAPPEKNVWDEVYRLKFRDIRYSESFAAELESKSYRIALPDIGPTIVRATGSAAERIPSTTMRVKRWLDDVRTHERQGCCRAIVDESSPGLAALAAPCEVCRKPDSLMYACLCCLRHVHDDCSPPHDPATLAKVIVSPSILDALIVLGATEERARLYWCPSCRALKGVLQASV